MHLVSIFLEIAKEWEHHRILKDEYPTELDKLVNFNDNSAVFSEDFRSDRYYVIRRKFDHIPPPILEHGGTESKRNAQKPITILKNISELMVTGFTRRPVFVLYLSRVPKVRWLGWHQS